MQDLATRKKELIERTFKNDVRHIGLDRWVNFKPALNELGEYDDEFRAALPEIAYAALAGVTCDPDPMAGDCHGFKVIFPLEWEWCYCDIAHECEKLGLIVLWSRTTEIGFPVKLGDVINGTERVVAIKEIKHDYFDEDGVDVITTWKVQLVHEITPLEDFVF
jgi:hypothetical protein